MTENSGKADSFQLPEDLLDKVQEISARLGESTRIVVIAAVDHFTRISEEQRKAALRATSIRRRGW
jgi:predicted transcriptional regulator